MISNCVAVEGGYEWMIRDALEGHANGEVGEGSDQALYVPDRPPLERDLG